MSYETLTLEVVGAVALVTMIRPDDANTVTLVFAQELSDVAIRCASDSCIRCVVLTGTGKFFSAGGDLKAFENAGSQLPAQLQKLTSILHGAISIFARMDKPMISAVNGHAAGAGLSLAVLGDFTIASDAASFTVAYSGAGLSPDGASTYWLPRLIGVRRTKELMITNRTLSASEAVAIGLINEVCPASDLLDTALGQAAELASGPTRAIAAIRSLLLDSLSSTLETQLEAEARHICAMGGFRDGKEGIAAFLEKRRPVFEGL